jgi:hypothetical protein
MRNSVTERVGRDISVYAADDLRWINFLMEWAGHFSSHAWVDSIL